MGIVGGVVEGTPTSAMTPCPSKVFANKETGIRIKGILQQGAMQIHMYVKKREGRKETKKKRAYTHEFNLEGEHFPLRQSQKFSSSGRAHPQDPQECPQTPQRTSPHQDHEWQSWE